MATSPKSPVPSIKVSKVELPDMRKGSKGHVRFEDRESSREILCSVDSGYSFISGSLGRVIDNILSRPRKARKDCLVAECFQPAFRLWRHRAYKVLSRLMPSTQDTVSLKVAY